MLIPIYQFIKHRIVVDDRIIVEKVKELIKHYYGPGYINIRHAIFNLSHTLVPEGANQSCIMCIQVTYLLYPHY